MINKKKEQPGQTRTKSSKIRVLAAFASPVGTQRLRLDSEERVIKEAIELSKQRNKFLLKTHQATTIRDLSRALLNKSFNIIHIASHGNGKGLTLARDDGGVALVDPATLADLFKKHASSIRCVILNACYSLEQGLLVSQVIPFTIAMEYALNDQAAIKFSEGFYDAVGAGQSIEEAYATDMLNKATQDFCSNKDRYESLIQNHLSTFVKEYTSSTLKALTLGFTIPELVEDLDEEKTVKLASNIHEDLEIEVKKHITVTLALYDQQLRQAKWSIGASFDRMHAIALTERLISKCGWDILKPLIESTVHTIFVQEFEEQVEQNFPYWIQLASSREIIKSIHNYEQLPLQVDTQNASLDKFMSGGTPFAQAIDKAAMRFIDEAYQKKNKILVIISDGEFQQSSLIKVTVDLLKKRGITIISCLMANKNLPTRILEHSPKRWPAGAKQMLRIASPIPRDNPSIHATQFIDNKLCIQLNHSAVVEDIFKFVLRKA